MTRAPLLIGALVALSASLSAAPTAAAVPHEARTEVKFVEGCSGEGFWFTWNAGVYERPAAAPGWDRRGERHPVMWSPAVPITVPDLGPETLEANRFGFMLFGADGGTLLFEGFYAVEGESPLGRFVLDVTLDCSTIPYSIVEMPNSALPVPTPPLAPLGIVLLSLGAALGLRRHSRIIHCG